MEMEAVANIFDRDGDGYVDYKEFVSALRPDRDVSFLFLSLVIYFTYYSEKCGGLYIFVCALHFAFAFNYISGGSRGSI